MRKLAGYICHRASVRLHEAAERLTGMGVEDGHIWHLVSCTECEKQDRHTCLACLGTGKILVPLTLHDVAPHLSAAVDVVRRKLERMHTVALRRIGL